MVFVFTLCGCAAAVGVPGCWRVGLGGPCVGQFPVGSAPLGAIWRHF